MLMCDGVRFKSTFQAVFLREFLAGCRFFKISVAQPVCPWPATRRWPPWKTQELLQSIYTFNQIQSDWINAFKALVKDIVYFSISSHAEIGTSESNNYQLVKRINSALFLFCTYYSAFYVYIFGTSFGVIFIVTTIECFTDLRDPDNAVSSRNYTL